MDHACTYCLSLANVVRHVEDADPLRILRLQSLEDSQSSIPTAVIHKNEANIVSERQESRETFEMKPMFFVVTGYDDTAPIVSSQDAPQVALCFPAPWRAYLNCKQLYFSINSASLIRH